MSDLVSDLLPAGPPDVLFGAFDRHNFGDMLLPHVLDRLLAGRPLRHAGLAERDLTPFGGHRVDTLARIAAQPGPPPAHLIHVGGEILCCEGWEAAVMLLPPVPAAQAATKLGVHAEARRAWARAQLGTDALAPYTAPPALFPASTAILYHAIGGIDLDRREAGLRAEVLDKLRAAAGVSVRDARTRAILAANGIAARLVPDAAALVAALFGDAIRQRARRGEPARALAAFAHGYLAVQFSADFGDDTTLDTLAAGLDRAARASGCGIVLFRAGAAPWHDDPRVYARLAQRLSAPPLLLRSLDIWDICAVIAHARAYAGSSLHGRIVAMAFGLPRLNLAFPGQAPAASKAAAFAECWESAGAPGAVTAAQLAEAVDQALVLAPERLAAVARDLAAEAGDGLVLP